MRRGKAAEWGMATTPGMKLVENFSAMKAGEEKGTEKIEVLLGIRPGN